MRLSVRWPARCSLMAMSVLFLGDLAVDLVEDEPHLGAADFAGVERKIDGPTHAVKGAADDFVFEGLLVRRRTIVLEWFDGGVWVGGAQVTDGAAVEHLGDEAGRGAGGVGGAW